MHTDVLTEASRISVPVAVGGVMRLMSPHSLPPGWAVLPWMPGAEGGTSAGRCSLFGHYHIHTFDGVLYDFPGDCSYMLAGDCSNRGFTLLGREQGLFAPPRPLLAAIFLRLRAKSPSAHLPLCILAITQSVTSLTGDLWLYR